MVHKKVQSDFQQKPLVGDPMMVVEAFQDPEDIIQDILVGMNATSSGGNTQFQNQIPTINYAKPSNLPRGEESPLAGGTPSMSVQHEVTSDLGNEEGDPSKSQSIYKVMQEPMDLDDMICRSICSFENQEQRKKLANQIVLVGGTAKMKAIVEVAEDLIMNKFSSTYDDSIDRVEIVLINTQQ
mmetsp:Transcript_13269/g.13068  ORF Transcript_13269/g.13068 Transcript_13269/m.13068 type:complete len:183 (+) Transcript_13269:763-1311(+)